MAKVLIVEDDIGICETVKDWLENQLHTVEAVHCGEDAIEYLKTYDYDVIILDLYLPDIDGLDILQKYRATGGTARVLILTGRNEVRDRERGLDLGADDYLGKPFHPRELAARLRALIRRDSMNTSTQLIVGKFLLDLTKLKLMRNGEAIQLLPKELTLMELFMRNPDHVFNAEQILQKVWSADAETSPETLRVHIKRLRDKIDVEGQPSAIQNIKGLGYKLSSENC
ncbi:MAG TPA: response regulator transcription factor [Candidatus Melainabacteria bacterium]|nr:response regulator transcription factor [Candidatus Melainabacteria bacterium]HIN67301.1 response regulator transcription factor [Candidatus Obscuribacterales bacterium]